MYHCDLQAGFERRFLRIKEVIEDFPIEDFYADLTVSICKVCGMLLVDVPKAESIGRAVARSIVLKESCLRGTEILYLRKRLGHSAKHFSSLLPSTPEHLSRLEHDAVAPSGVLDRMIRISYILSSGDGELLNTLARDFERWTRAILQQRSQSKFVAHECESSWTIEKL